MTSATIQRVQTLQSIDAPYLHVFTTPAICVITTLKYYLATTHLHLATTHLLRGTPNQLVFYKTHYPVSKDTIAQWTNVVMFEAGVDVTFLKAHSLKQN